jgi:hypothetical protein
MPIPSSQMNSGHQHLGRAIGRDGVQDDQGAHDADQRPTDQPEQGQARGHQAGSVHQPPQDQAVPMPAKTPGPIRNVHS